MFDPYSSFVVHGLSRIIQGRTSPSDTDGIPFYTEFKKGILLINST